MFSPTGVPAPPARTPVVGIIGGGQLARMMLQAAVALDVDIRLLAATADDSAARVAPRVTVGSETAGTSILPFAADCDVVTFDHEHVPQPVLADLASRGIPARPGASALRHAQDKTVLRRALADLHVPQPRFAVVDPAALADPAACAAAVTAAATDLMGPAGVVVKTARGGYDGKGVWVCPDPAEAAAVVGRIVAAAHAAGTDPVPVVLEECVPFVRELAAVAVRRPAGEVVVYPTVETVQRDGICHEVVAPAAVDPEVDTSARDLARNLATRLGVVGVLAVELFETADGRVLVNEFAMRPHNSGHWTIEGAVTSQFENHLRAVLDWPLGATDAREPATVMVNLLGGADPDLAAAAGRAWTADPAARVHTYGKRVRPGRKIGHITVTGSDVDEVRARARRAAAAFLDPTAAAPAPSPSTARR